MYIGSVAANGDWDAGPEPPPEKTDVCRQFSGGSGDAVTQVDS